MLSTKRVGKDVPVIDLWQRLHLNAIAWENILNAPSLEPEKHNLDLSTASYLNSLSELSHDIWHSLCTAAGMTVYGAIALSWCQDAEISQVWDDWEASGFLLKPLPESERPARFINPDLLPQTSSLNEIINFCPDKSLPICATIAALKSPLEFDLPVENLKTANPQLASFLKSRMQQKSGRTAEEDELIQVWSQTVSGTEWEV